MAPIPMWRADNLLSELAAGYIDVDEFEAAVAELRELWELEQTVLLEELSG